MRNVPPSPANYAQRAGRTGRETRTGVIAGFARGTPHDGYFFDHPEEVISGAIPPPRFNLENLSPIERHVNSLVLEAAALEYANNLEALLTDCGELIEANVADLVRRLEQATVDAKARAVAIFGKVGGVSEVWLDRAVELFPTRVRSDLRVNPIGFKRKRGARVQITQTTDIARYEEKLSAIRLLPEFVILSPISLAQAVLEGEQPLLERRRVSVFWRHFPSRPASVTALAARHQAAPHEGTSGPRRPPAWPNGQGACCAARVDPKLCSYRSVSVHQPIARSSKKRNAGPATSEEK